MCRFDVDTVNDNSTTQATTQCSRSDFEIDDPDKKSSPQIQTSSLSTSVDDIVSTKVNSKDTIKSGYLKKQGGKIKTWHERWFVLTKDYLNYYKDADGKYLVIFS